MTNLSRINLALAYSLVFCGCSFESNLEINALQKGIWRGELEVQEKLLPFNFELLQGDEGAVEMILHNAEERIVIDDLSIIGDSLYVNMHIFDATLKAKISGDKMIGRWTKNYLENHWVPFNATLGNAYRFSHELLIPKANISGKWEVRFISPGGDTTLAMGILRQDDHVLEGTFLTISGDYRYMEGNVWGDRLALSTFDGASAMLVNGSIVDTNTLKGEFYSGRSENATWIATRNEKATLPDPDEITSLKEGYDEINFTFPDLNGKMVSLDDAQYQGKVVIIQLFGTWCPNCMDETIFLNEWYKKNSDKNLEIIGLAYEKKDDYAYARKRVLKMIKELKPKYDYLIAGTATVGEASKSLPMLDGVKSFPTLIFIDKNGKVRRIYTGFRGPGTGEYYQEFTKDFEAYVASLLKENS